MVKPETDSKEKQDGAESSHGLAHRLRQRSLRAAGIGTLIADISLIAYGLSSAGVFGILAGTVGTRYGNPKAEKRLEQVERRLGAYLRRQGVEIPKDPTAKALTKKEGVIDHIEDFLYKYPSQVMNVFYGLIGEEFARAAITKQPKMDKKLLASGCLLMSGALAGLLIKEKKPDPEHPAHNVFEKAKNWVQEKPLRLSGSLFNANQVMLTWSALDERKDNPGKHRYLFKLVAVAGFTFGNIMMMLSPKSSGTRNKLDQKTLEQLADVSASVIAAQPKQVQDAVLEQVVTHLTSEPNVQMKPEAIRAMLQESMAQRMATAAASWQTRVLGTKGATEQSL